MNNKFNKKVILITRGICLITQFYLCSDLRTMIIKLLSVTKSFSSLILKSLATEFFVGTLIVRTIIFYCCTTTIK